MEPNRTLFWSKNRLGNPWTGAQFPMRCEYFVNHRSVPRLFVYNKPVSSRLFRAARSVWSRCRRVGAVYQIAGVLRVMACLCSGYQDTRKPERAGSSGWWSRESARQTGEVNTVSCVHCTSVPSASPGQQGHGGWASRTASASRLGQCRRLWPRLMRWAGENVMRHINRW